MEMATQQQYYEYIRSYIQVSKRGKESRLKKVSNFACKVQKLYQPVNKYIKMLSNHMADLAPFHDTQCFDFIFFLRGCNYKS
jgi:hypothetical protein